MVASLSEVVIDRLEKTIPMQSQVVSVEDRLTLEEIQTSLTSVIIAIIQRLEKEMMPQADRIMQLLLNLLNSVGTKSAVPDTIFAAIGAMANALEGDFEKYMQSFSPYLLNALNNQDEPQLCAMAIGLVSDITRALESKVGPFCDAFMNALLSNLRSPALGNQFKPAILQCFGDIAQAIGGDFETYLSVVAQVLQQAAGINVQTENNANFEMLDYIVSLREGIMDAWGGIVMALRAGNKGESFHVPSSLQRSNMLTTEQRAYCSHMSSRSFRCCTQFTPTRTALRRYCELLWVLLGKFSSPRAVVTIFGHC
jgi:importin subunit beta-1